MESSISSRKKNTKIIMQKIVGLLSMQRAKNYGSFLQAYALKQLLLKNGAQDVYFIDIEDGVQLSGYEENQYIKKFIRIMKYVINGQLGQKRRDLKFLGQLYENFENNFKLLQLDRTSPHNYDLAVIGSDEVFHCCQQSSWGFSLQLYGKIPNAEEVVSYAGSFSHTSLQDLRHLKIDDAIRDTMKTMKAISVRDEHSAKIVENLLGIKPEIHLDPVLIYGYQQEIASQGSKDLSEPYLLVYSYQGRISDKQEVNNIVLFARKNRLKLISILSRYDWCDEAVIPQTPLDVLSWFSGAKYVVTDTFHGTIFSVITKRPFCTLIRESNREKISYLLRGLNLFSRGSSDIEFALKKSIDYQTVDSILNSERKKANAYLTKYLQF